MNKRCIFLIFILQWVDGPLLLCMLPEDVGIIAEHLKEHGIVFEEVKGQHDVVNEDTGDISKQLEQLL